jgi:hypothetical protein
LQKWKLKELVQLGRKWPMKYFNKDVFKLMQKQSDKQYLQQFYQNTLVNLTNGCLFLDVYATILLFPFCAACVP